MLGVVISANLSLDKHVSDVSTQRDLLSLRPTTSTYPGLTTSIHFHYGTKNNHVVIVPSLVLYILLSVSIVGSFVACAGEKDAQKITHQRSLYSCYYYTYLYISYDLTLGLDHAYTLTSYHICFVSYFSSLSTISYNEC